MGGVLEGNLGWRQDHEGSCGWNSRYGGEGPQHLCVRDRLVLHRGMVFRVFVSCHSDSRLAASRNTARLPTSRTPAIFIAIQSLSPISPSNTQGYHNGCNFECIHRGVRLVQCEDHFYQLMPALSKVTIFISTSQCQLDALSFSEIVVNLIFLCMFENKSTRKVPNVTSQRKGLRSTPKNRFAISAV